LRKKKRLSFYWEYFGRTYVKAWSLNGREKTTSIKEKKHEKNIRLREKIG
jgi:hypothetical protein